MKRSGPSWRTKLAILMSLFAMLPVGALAYMVLEALEQDHRRAMLTSLEGIATAKAAAINQLTDTRTRDVERIAGLLAPRVAAVLAAEAQLDQAREPPPEPLPELRDAEQLVTDPSSRPVEQPPVEAPEPDPAPPRGTQRAEQQAALGEARAAVRRALGLILWDQADFEELLVIDLRGRVLASTYAEHQGRSAESLGYFQSGRRATYVQPVFLSPITERLTMVISTPIRDPDTREIGVLAARLNLQGLFALINDTTGLGETGETVVGKRIGEELVFMAPTRHDPGAALSRRYALDDSARTRAMLQAASGHSGADVSEDYRGRRVLAAWRPVRALGWGLVVKMDEAEAMRAADAVRSKTIEISLAILVMAVLASILVSRELVRPLRDLIDATDRISRGDLSVRLSISSADEIGELADSFERMVAAIKFFREHARREDEEPLELDAPPSEEPSGTPSETSERA